MKSNNAGEIIMSQLEEMSIEEKIAYAENEIKEWQRTLDELKKREKRNTNLRKRKNEENFCNV